MNGADVEISFKDNKLRKVCTEYKIEQATNLKDIILYIPQFHFHKLKGNYEGFFCH